MNFPSITIFFNELLCFLIRKMDTFSFIKINNNKLIYIKNKDIFNLYRIKIYVQIKGGKKIEK